MNEISVWKPTKDDVIGIFVGMLLTSGVYALTGINFIGLTTTTVLMEIIFIILLLHSLIFREKYTNTNLPFLVVILAGLGFIASAFTLLSIALLVYILAVSLVLAYKALYYLSIKEIKIN